MHRDTIKITAIYDAEVPVVVILHVRDLRPGRLQRLQHGAPRGLAPD